MHFTRNSFSHTLEEKNSDPKPKPFTHVSVHSVIFIGSLVCPGVYVKLKMHCIYLILEEKIVLANLQNRYLVRFMAK